MIVDTSVLIALERNLLNIDKLIAHREEELFGISVITAYELLHGVFRANTEKRRLRREAFVEKILQKIPIYSFDLTSARIYARLWANLAKKGINVGSHILMILLNDCEGFLSQEKKITFYHPFLYNHPRNIVFFNKEIIIP